jgi:uncharacterized protein
MKIKKLTAILKVTAACNLNCTYCYESGSKNRSMHEDVLFRCMDEFMSVSDDCTIILHGGEPLCANRDLIRAFLDYGEKNRSRGKRINYHLQTNGMLYDRGWIELFRKYNVSVGVSIDGPKELHDKYRRTHNGKGSHEAVCNNLNRAEKAGIEKGCLCVITRESLTDINSLFDFFERLSIKDIDFLPCMTENNKNGRSVDLTLTPEEYAEFIIKYFNLWNVNGSSSSVRSFCDYFEILNGNNPVSCHLLYPKICGWEVISIDTDGDVYPCDSFAGHKEMRMGNIVVDGLKKMYSSKMSREFYETANTIPPDCKSCRYLKYCFGGCLYHRYFRAGNLLDKSYYCEAYKNIFRYFKKQKLQNYADTI